MRVFGDFRQPIYTSLFYGAPKIERISVTDLSIPSAVTTQTYDLQDLNSGPVLLPTTDGRVTIEGKNFGRYPVLNIVGTSLGENIFDWYSFGGYNAQRSHTELVFDSPKGQGYMYPLQLLVGDQSIEDGGNQRLNSSFKPPAVTEFEQFPPTRGGVWVNITGANFG